MRKIILLISLLYCMKSRAQSCDSLLIIYTTVHEFGEADYSYSRVDSLDNGLVTSSTFNGIRTDFTYDSFQNLISVKVGADSTVYAYDANTRIISTDYYQKNINIWQYKSDTSRVENYYSSHGLDSIIKFNWNGIAMIPFNRTYYSYNANDTLIQKQHEFYDSTQWVVDTITVVTYIDDSLSATARIDSAYRDSITPNGAIQISYYDSLDRILYIETGQFYFEEFEYECNQLEDYYRSCIGCHSGYSSYFEFDSLCRIESNSYGFYSYSSDNPSYFDRYFYVGCSTMAIAASGNVKICKGDSTTIYASHFGGTGPFSVQWSPSIGLASDTSLVTKASPDSTTTYIITARDANNVEVSDTVIVAVVVPPIAHIFIESIDTISGCQSAVLAVDSLTSDYRSTWLFNGVYAFNPYSHFTITYNGNYSAYVSLDAPNYGVCPTDSDSIAFNYFTHEPPIPVVTRSCNEVYATANVPSSFQWYFQGVIIPGATNDTLSVDTLGTFQVIATDSLGCVSALSNGAYFQDISVTPLVRSSCLDSCNGSIFLNSSASYSYTWSNGETTQSVTNLCTGIYSVIITDYLGCTITMSDTIGEYSGAGFYYLTTGTSSALACDGIVFPVDTSNAPYNATYLWEDNTNDLMKDSLCSGWHTVLTTPYYSHCPQIDSFYVPSSLSSDTCHLTNIHTNPTCNGYNNGSLTIGSTTGSPFGTYLYSTSFYTPFYNHMEYLHAGSYSFMIIDQNGCVDSATITLTEPIPITATFNVYQSFCDDTCMVTANVLGGTPPYNYQWCNGSTVNPLRSCAPNCLVSIRDSNNCILSSSITQPLTYPLTLQLYNTPPTCSFCHDGIIIINASGGNPPYTITVDSGVVVDDTIYNVTNTIHRVCLKGADSCLVCKDVQFSVGVGSLDFENKFSVYPNPFHEKIFFNFDEYNPASQTRFVLFDALGQIVKELNVSGKRFELYRGNLTPGVYTFVIESKDEVVKRGRVVVQ